MNLGKENEQIEFKESTSELSDALIDITAILNKHNCGTLYFGLKYNGDVCGMQVGDSTIRDIFRKVFEKIKPQILKLHISEKTGWGIPTITNKYGKESNKVSENNIIVTIPFNRINDVGDKVGDKLNSAWLNFSQIKVLAEIRNNPNITKPQLMVKCNIGKTSIDNIIKILKNKGYIKRIGAYKNGYWEVLK